MLRPPPRPPLFPYTTLFRSERRPARRRWGELVRGIQGAMHGHPPADACGAGTLAESIGQLTDPRAWVQRSSIDRKRSRLNSSHVEISYAVFCLKKKKKKKHV